MACFDEQDTAAIIQTIHNAVVKLKSCVLQQKKTDTVATSDVSSSSQPAKKVCLSLALFGVSKSSVSCGATSAEEVLLAVNTEIVQYQCEPKLEYIVGCDAQGKAVHGNPLDWWRINATKCTTLAALARKLLCIPATSAPSERIFSHAGQTLTGLRASLSTSNVSELVFLHDSWETNDKLTSEAEISCSRGVKCRKYILFVLFKSFTSPFVLQQLLPHGMRPQLLQRPNLTFKSSHNSILIWLSSYCILYLL